MKRVFAMMLACLLPTAAAAHDAASLDVIGFSDDGKLFAYEEFSDKDLDCYSTINVIDLDTGNDVKGSPVDSEADPNDKDDKRSNMSLRDVRREARAKAQPLLERFKERANPPQLYAATPITQVGAGVTVRAGEEASLRFSTSLLLWGGMSYEIRLKAYEIQPSAPNNSQLSCPEEDSKGLGFKLSLVRFENDKQIGEPKAVRWNSAFGRDGCVQAYRLTQIVGYDEANVVVVLIAFWQPAFEGPHQRYLAVPVKLDGK